MLETTPTGLDVLTTKVAQDGYLVMSNTTTTDKALKQQPYRWGQADQVAVAVNAGEFVGKQLVGKKAEYAGSADLQKSNRVIGVVYPPAVFDLQKWFVPEVEKQGGKIAPNAILEYTSNGTTVGDPSSARGAGADHGREAQGPRRHHGGDVHRRGDGQGDDRAGDPARVPARVDHRRLPVPGPRPPRAVPTTRTNGRMRSASRTCSRT